MSWKSIFVIIIWIIISAIQYNRANGLKDLLDECQKSTTSLLKTCNNIADQSIEMRETIKQMQSRAVINYKKTKKELTR